VTVVGIAGQRLQAQDELPARGARVGDCSATIWMRIRIASLEMLL
jgi:hypothetical protein